MKTDLRSHMWGLQAKFMHDPTCFDSIRSSVPVKHQCLPHPYNLLCSWLHHRPILPCSFPITGNCCPIRSEPGRVFSVTEAEEVPLVCVQLCHLFNLIKSPMHIYTQIMWLINFIHTSFFFFFYKHNQKSNQ